MIVAKCCHEMDILAWLVHPTRLAQSDEELLEWLKQSPWGRCVYHCDNDAVDHQTVGIEFENGVTATFTMTAFDDGRRLEIYGSEGVLVGHPASYRDPAEELTLTRHHEPGREAIEIQSAQGGHGGGDQGLVEALYQNITGSNETDLLQDALTGHEIAFAAEAARLAQPCARWSVLAKRPAPRPSAGVAANHRRPGPSSRPGHPSG